ncbi:MAG: 4Fe-4S binding protein [Clostridia bacterium]|nr:4Fe-4S binding protein [Clostridia bacterium]
MKVILYVFSGTGNTLKVAGLYKKFLQEHTASNADAEASESDASASVDIYRISAKSGEIPNPDEYDLVGIGYPIHGFSAPEPTIRLCKALPKTDKKRTFIFKTSGEGLHINDCSSQKCIKILKKKGYDVVSERHIVMPYNMIYRHTDEMAKQMWIYAHALVDLSCRDLLADKREKVDLPFFKQFYCPPIRFLEQKFAHLHGPAFKVNSKKCIKCNRCVNVCPTDNIQIKNGKYKFGHNCVLCMGCSFGCPMDAINVGVFGLWKVHGSYEVEKLKDDENIPFPYVPEHAKGIYRLYKKYYKECDEMLAEAGINVYDYIQNKT